MILNVFVCLLCLYRLLTLYNVELRYVSPPGLGMPDHIVDYVNERRISQQKFSSLEEALPDTDVLYMMRIQRERFNTQEEYHQVGGFRTHHLTSYICPFTLENVLCECKHILLIYTINLAKLLLKVVR